MKLMGYTSLIFVYFFVPSNSYVKEPFSIYWNVPTELCHKYGFNFSEVSSIGIIQNSEDNFKGNKIVILYDPGLFPAYLNGLVRNGGVPQEGDLEEHLKEFEIRLSTAIPDLNFKGIGIIDFERWRPIWRENWGKLDIYRKKSKEMERILHPWWPSKEIERNAQRRFEKAAYTFIEETLALAIRLRPNGFWGYYGFPYCFNFTPKNPYMKCQADIIRDNNRSGWMFQTGTALYPSVYMSQNALSEAKRSKMVEGRIHEATRIKSLNPSRRIKVLPYFWYKYRDTKTFLSKADMKGGISASQRAGSDGLVIWGSSNDTNSQKNCELLHNYVINVIKPILLTQNRNLKIKYSY